MYGELDDTIDLIKIHINSGKLTLTHYDDFDKSVPYLVERTKIKMADQSIDFLIMLKSLAGHHFLISIYYWIAWTRNMKTEEL